MANNNGSLKARFFKSLQSEEGDLGSFLMNASDGLLFFEIGGSNGEWANEKFWQSLGYQMDHPEVKRLTSWREAVYEEDLPTINEELLTLEEEAYNDFKSTVELESRFIHAEGHLLWFNWKMFVSKEKDKPAFIVALLYNNADQKKKEELLLRHENQISRIQEALMKDGDMVFIHEPDYTFINYFIGDYKDFMMQPSAFIGKKFTEIGLPEEAVTIIKSAFDQVVEKGEKASAVYYLENDNEKQYYQMHLSPVFKKSGKVGEVISIIQNVTEQLKDEQYHEMLALVAKYTTDAIVITDENGYTTWVNNGFVATCGYTLHEMVGKKPGEVLQGPETGPEAIEKMRNAIKHQAPTQVDILNYRKDGSSYWMSLQIGPVFKEDGSVDKYISVGRDITQKVVAERKLRNSQKYLQILIDNFPKGSITLVDQHLNVLHTGGNGYRNTGLSAEGLISKNLREFAPAQVTDTIMANLPALKTGEVYKHEVAIEKLTFLNTYQSILDVNGEIGTTVIVSEDITKSKQAQKALLKEESKYRSLFNNTLDALFLTNDEAQYIETNTAATKLLGYSKEEFMRMDLSSLAPHIPKKIIKRQWRSFLAEGKMAGEYSVCHKNGSIRIIEFRAVANVEKGLHLSVMRDITEQKQAVSLLHESKERFRLLFEKLNIGMVIHKPDTKIIYCNPKAVELLGYKSSDELFGASVYDTFWDLVKENGEKFTADDSSVSQAIKQKKGVFGVVVGAFNQLENKRIWLKADAVPQLGKNGEVEQVFVSFVDISKQKEIAHDLHQARNKADSANRAKSEFLANMSHEIRTPLNGVIGFTDLLMDTDLNPVQKKYMKSVHQSANALLDIINDVLDFSKIEAGKLELYASVTNLSALIEQATNHILYQVEDSGLELSINIDNDAPKHVLADNVRLRQVLVNLLSNAVKFTKVGSIKLSLELLERLSPKKVKLRFTVEDTGVGIAPANQKKIFEAFIQEDIKTTKLFGGTGLGLSISNKLLALMNSKLRLESALGQGSKFYFDLELPFSDESTEQWDLLEEVSTVLVVDDLLDNRLLLRDLLEKKGIVVTEAESGIKAIQILQHTTFDVLLIDYHMPYLDGIETIRYIKDNLEGTLAATKVMIVNSLEDDKAILAARKGLKVDGTLLKPVTSQKLFNGLAALFLDNQQKNRKVAFTAATIMVAEDEEVNRLLIKTLLEHLCPEGTFIMARNGSEAISLFHKESPDLILMDLQMPIVNGVDACKAIRGSKDGTTVPIIALTAATTKEEIDRCFAVGMNDYLSKPLTNSRLVATLEKWLQKDKSEKQAGVKHSTRNKINLRKSTKTKSFDKEVLLNKLHGDVELYHKVLEKTIEQLQEGKKMIAKAIKAKDKKKIESYCHKLKGTAFSTEFEKLGQIAQELMKTANLEEAELESLHKALEKEIAKVIREMKLLQNAKNK